MEQIGVRRIVPLWRLLDGITEDDWHTVIEDAQVAVADDRRDWRVGQHVAT